MSGTVIEHVNVTVSDPDQTARNLCEIFGWRIRWQGDAIMNGRTVHVGGDDSYLALYSPKEQTSSKSSSYSTSGGLNHVGVVVDDLDEIERRVLAAGFESHNHGSYEPGKRFYFNDHDGIEYEVVNYPAN